MKYTKITANGEFELAVNDDNKTHSTKVTVYGPADMGTATVTLGYKDNSGTFTTYINGVLAANDQLLVNSGWGVPLFATITTFSTAFDIGVAQSVNQ